MSLLGKTKGHPVCALLGGTAQEDLVLWRAVSQASLEEMAWLLRFAPEEGSSQGSVANWTRKLNGFSQCARRCCLLVANANVGRTRHKAERVFNAVVDQDI